MEEIFLVWFCLLTNFDFFLHKLSCKYRIVRETLVINLMEKKRTCKALKRASKFSDQDFYVQSETCYPLTKYLHNVRAVIKR